MAGQRNADSTLRPHPPRYGHGENDTGAPGLCPGDPAGPHGCGDNYCQCGWTIGCPASSCRLAPAPGHGCLSATDSECSWSNITAAQQYWSEWDDCTAFHCERTVVTDPGGCGDCPQPAGGWCKCTVVTTCQARGAGAALSGGGSGDQQDYAFFKAGNASGWLQARDRAPPVGTGVGVGRGGAASGSGSCHLKPGAPGVFKAVCEAAPTQAACTMLNETCVWTPTPIPPAPPTPTGARQFVFDFETGRIVFADTGETWVQSPLPPPPPPPPSPPGRCADVSGAYDSGLSGRGEKITQAKGTCTITLTAPTQPWSPATGTVAGKSLTVDFGAAGSIAGTKRANGDLQWANGALWEKGTA